jgi:hypothetical protein
MFDLADQLVTLRDEKKKSEDRLKKLNAAIDEVGLRLSDMMEAQETQNFTRAGKTFYLTTKPRASAIAGAREKLYAALKDNGCGDLVYETVNANSLNSFVKEQRAENDGELPEWLQGVVSVYDEVKVGVRKAT